MTFRNFLIFSTLVSFHCRGKIVIPKFTQRIFTMEGDINIGALTRISDADPNGLCKKAFQTSTNLEFVEAIIYGVKTVNQRTDLLPNVTLGVVIVDDCQKDLASLAGATYFASNKWDKDSTCSNSSHEYDLPFNKVVGVVGGDSSRMSVMASSFLSIFQIPLISPTASSDELSDKSRFEYFLRMVPPDTYQAYCMVDFLIQMNWTYVSVLFSEGSYGENGAKQVEERIKSTSSICIAISYRIPSHPTKNELDDAVDLLLKHVKARLVITFLNDRDLAGVYTSLRKKGLDNYFIILGSDTVFHAPYGRHGDGNLAINFPTRLHEGFINYYRSLTPLISENPWFNEYWEMINNCSWEVREGRELCTNESKVERLLSDEASIQYLRIDAVMAYAYAIDDVIRKYCPDAFNDHQLLDACIQGQRLLWALKNLTFPGYVGPVDFDEFGNVIGQYVITQYVHSLRDYVIVGKWDQRTLSLTLEDSQISWDSLQKKANSSLLVSLGLEPLPAIPESVCSKPCKQKEYYVEKDQICCWECQICRDNEILIDNLTGCLACPLLLWPDDETATVCLQIEPTFLQWNDSTTIGLAILTSLGFVSSVVILVLYILNREKKLIKASSKELSLIIIAGTILAYLSVLPALMKPTNIACGFNRNGFNLSVTCIYGPLVVKTNRIYRIFSSGKRGNTRPSMINNKSQLLITSFLLIIQVILTIVSGLIAPPIARLRMQVPTEKHVELFCDLPLQGLLTPLVYNICLMLLCAIFGFMTRKLPANFNESWFIFISVSTTSFLWVVILPTYFTQFYAYNQAALLSVCLIINATVTMVLLYVPKIYAIYFVDDEKIQFGTIGTNESIRVEPVTSETNA